ncbi:MAG: transposase [Patescibacteria group bacterium]|nr:transposase [Patescibacteria group bacterium]
MNKLKFKPAHLYDKNSIYFITFHTYHFEKTLNNNTFSILYQAFRNCQKVLEFKVYAYVFMPNHCHLLIMPVKYSISKIMFRIKGSSAYYINKSLNKNGKFWEDNYYDHIIRDEKDFEKHFNYIHNNPVKHGLASNPEDWKWSSYKMFIKNSETSRPKGRAT